MRIAVATDPPERLGADLTCVGIFDDETLPDVIAAARGADDARSRFKAQTVAFHDAIGRVAIIGLGERAALTGERLRVAAALGCETARRLGVADLAWLDPSGPDLVASERHSLLRALAEGTVLAAYEFDRLRSPDPDRPRSRLQQLSVAVAADATAGAEDALRSGTVSGEAANRARVLQEMPANLANPPFLAQRAREIAAAHDTIEVTILGADELGELGCGGIIAVAAGSAFEPQLINLRYSGGGDQPPLAIVGKAVTFDSGGISIKPSASMHEMKMDMSGGAAALEATAAIAGLGLPLNLLTVVPVVENMPSGTATRPGDVITQLDGTTVEVTNTDAEGRLILADAITWARREGAGRIVDLATLTGAVVVALGSTYSALIANDDGWAQRVEAAAADAGEPCWRLPLHDEYRELTKGTVADLVNSAAKRKAGTIYAGAFLEHFAGDTPWAHLDIAGTAWDTGREYFGAGPTGSGTRTLIALARSLCGEAG